MVKLNFFDPEEHLDSVKQSLFAAGAGRIGNYDSCCWQTLGTGQFRPLQGSDPFLGQQGKVEQVAEYKVELVCEDSVIKAVIEALKRSHPYDEPAFDVIKLENY